MEDTVISKKVEKLNTIIKRYVPLDYVTVRRGSSDIPKKDSHSIAYFLTMRFSVLELLFSSLDVGIEQTGIVETTVDAMKSCNENMWPHLLRNILVVGGCSLFSGSKERLYNELRSLISLTIYSKIYSSWMILWGTLGTVVHYWRKLRTCILILHIRIFLSN